MSDFYAIFTSFIQPKQWCSFLIGMVKHLKIILARYIFHTQSKIFVLLKLISLGPPKCLFVRCLLVLVLRHIRHNVAEFLTMIVCNDIHSLHYHEMKSIHYIVKVDCWFNLQTNNDEKQGLFEKMTVYRLLDIQLIPPTLKSR